MLRFICGLTCVLASCLLPAQAADAERSDIVRYTSKLELKSDLFGGLASAVREAEIVFEERVDLRRSDVIHCAITLRTFRQECHSPLPFLNSEQVLSEAQHDATRTYEAVIRDDQVELKCTAAVPDDLDEDVQDVLLDSIKERYVDVPREFFPGGLERYQKVQKDPAFDRERVDQNQHEWLGRTERSTAYRIRNLGENAAEVRYRSRTRQLSERDPVELVQQIPFRNPLTSLRAQLKHASGFGTASIDLETGRVALASGSGHLGVLFHAERKDGGQQDVVFEMGYEVSTEVTLVPDSVVSTNR